jgi:hypothetical protein
MVFLYRAAIKCVRQSERSERFWRAKSKTVPGLPLFVGPLYIAVTGAYRCADLAHLLASKKSRCTGSRLSYFESGKNGLKGVEKGRMFT